MIAKCDPLFALSNSPAPKFCETKVARANWKQVIGKKAKLSIFE